MRNSSWMFRSNGWNVNRSELPIYQFETLGIEMKSNANSLSKNAAAYILRQHCDNLLESLINTREKWFWLHYALNAFYVRTKRNLMTPENVISNILPSLYILVFIFFFPPVEKIKIYKFT